MTMTAEQDQLFYDFRAMATYASSVEIDGCYFVHHFDYDCGTLHIEYQDDDGGFKIHIDGVCGAILAGILSWDSNSLSFAIIDTDGNDREVRFMTVTALERKDFNSIK